MLEIENELDIMLSSPGGNNFSQKNTIKLGNNFSNKNFEKKIDTKINNLESNQNPKKKINYVQEIQKLNFKY
jgi:hypothetical protein